MNTYDQALQQQKQNGLRSLIDKREHRNPTVPFGDVKWLREQIRLHRIPQRQIARAIDTDPSSLSRSLTGERQMSVAIYASALAYLDGLMRHSTPIQRAVWASRLTLGQLAAATKLPMPRLVSIIEGQGDLITPDESSRLRRYLNLRPGTDLGSTPLEQQRSGRAPATSGEVWAQTIQIFDAPEPLGGGLYRRGTSVLEERPRPPMLFSVQEAFGFFLSDQELVPRWYPGEVLYVHPGKKGYVGSWMIVDLEDGSMAIGRIEALADGKLELSRPLASGSMVLYSENISGMGAIVGSWSD